MIGRGWHRWRDPCTGVWRRWWGIYLGAAASVVIPCGGALAYRAWQAQNEALFPSLFAESSPQGEALPPLFTESSPQGEILPFGTNSPLPPAGAILGPAPTPGGTSLVPRTETLGPKGTPVPEPPEAWVLIPAMILLWRTHNVR